MSVCLFRPQEVSAHLSSLLASQPDAMLVDHRGRAMDGVLCGSAEPLRLAMAPQHRVIAPAPGYTVRLDVPRDGAVTGFYTHVVGEVAGVWALATPRVVRQRVERRRSVRVPLADQEGLVLQVGGGHRLPVIDVSPGGLSFRCDLAAPWARMRRSQTGFVLAPGVEPVPVRLVIQHLRLDPGERHTRIAGASLTVLGQGAAWWWELHEAMLRGTAGEA